jgi:protein-tyrosine phosphatase
MDWITADIAVGNYLEAQNASLLKEQGICSVLGLDRTLQNREGAELGLADMEIVPLEDGPGNDPRLFRLAVAALVRLAREWPPVLVHCHAG